MAYQRAENPADRPSRFGSKPEDIMYGSEWQVGKQFLRLPRSLWPLERRFASERKNKIQIALGEINRKYRNLLKLDVPSNTVNLTHLESAVVKVGHMYQSCNIIEGEVMGPEHMSNPIVKKFQGGYITNDWQKLLRRTAMYFKWMAMVAQKNQRGGKTACLPTTWPYCSG